MAIASHTPVSKIFTNNGTEGDIHAIPATTAHSDTKTTTDARSQFISIAYPFPFSQPLACSLLLPTFRRFQPSSFLPPDAVGLRTTDSGYKAGIAHPSERMTMKKLLLAALVAVTLLGASQARADSVFGVTIAPKQNIGAAIQNPETQVGASARVAKVGAVNLSGLVLVNDNLGLKYGAVAGLHLFSHTELGIASTYSHGFSKPFLVLTVRL